MKLSNIESDYILPHLLPLAQSKYDWTSKMLQLPTQAPFYQEGLPTLQQAIMDNVVINIFALLIKTGHDDTIWIKDNGGFLPLVKYTMPSYKGNEHTLLMTLRRYDESSDRYFIATLIMQNYEFHSRPIYGNDTDLKVWRAVRKQLSNHFLGFSAKAFEKGVRIAYRIITGKKSDIRTVKLKTT